MITEKEVKHIAKLARLSLTSTKVKKFQKELSSILDYIQQLKKSETKNFQMVDNAVFLENIMREDQEKEKLREKSEKLLALAPETKNGYLKIKPIF